MLDDYTRLFLLYFVYTAATMMQTELGRRGEHLFSVIITRFYGRPQPIFRPQFLGDKWPVADFLVELTGDTLPIIPYFFAQIKTTRLGYDRQNRLRIQVTAAEVQNLNALPAPTYVIGIDDITEQGYLSVLSGCFRAALTV